jgi:hypothetical protein
MLSSFWPNTTRRMNQLCSSDLQVTWIATSRASVNRTHVASVVGAHSPADRLRETLVALDLAPLQRTQPKYSKKE